MEIKYSIKILNILRMLFHFYYILYNVYYTSYEKFGFLLLQITIELLFLFLLNFKYAISIYTIFLSSIYLFYIAYFILKGIFILL